MIRPLAAPPVAAGASCIRKDKEQATPFQDWLASQQPAPAPVGAAASPAVQSRAPVSVTAPAVSASIARDDFAEAPATMKTAAPVASDMVHAPIECLPPSTRFAAQLRTHGGSVELIALPWRLVATGRLAHLFAPHGPEGLPVRAIEVRPSGPAAGAYSPAALHSAAEFDEAYATSDDWNARPASADVAAHDAMESADDDRLAPASAHRQAALPWTARLLRWIEANGGAATLWLRDYHLDERGIPHVLATLRAAAAEAGLRLDRIVINGRTHWHLHRPTRETTHAG